MHLTEQEAAKALELLTSSRDRLKALVEVLSTEQWHAQPSPEVWSPGLIVAHLQISEESILSDVEALLEGAESPADLLAATESQEARLLRHVPNRTRRVSAPLHMIPTGAEATPGEGFARFAAAREKAIAMLSRPGLKTRARAHFTLGPLTGYQWLIMVAVHCTRHAAQIEEQIASGS